jgi:hypothetical protein
MHGTNEKKKTLNLYLLQFVTYRGSENYYVIQFYGYGEWKVVKFMKAMGVDMLGR